MTGRYVQSDPIGLDGGENTFVYVKNGPMLHFDLKGELIYVRTHEVGFGFYHSSLLFIPDNSTGFCHTWRFRIGRNGRCYSTLGAGPNWRWNLASGYNRDKDVNEPKAGWYQVPVRGLESTLMLKIFNKDNHYDDNAISYELFPSPQDDERNSNSYISGLLRASGIWMSKPRENVPGWDIPVAHWYFR